MAGPYLQTGRHGPVHQQHSVMRHLILEPELGSLSEAGGHQLGPPLQEGQGHMLQGQTVRLLKVLHGSKCIAASPLDCRLFAEIEVIHGAVAETICMVQTRPLQSQAQLTKSDLAAGKRCLPSMNVEDQSLSTRKHKGAATHVLILVQQQQLPISCK